MKKQILLAEDEDELRDLLAVELRDHNFEVIEASNGRVAAELFSHHKINLVITDLRMPGGDGLELLTFVRNLKDPQMKTILMSGFADCSLSQAREFGAHELLHKPFGLGDFLKTVNLLLTR